MDEKRKLNIIIYNKKYQNQLKVNIEYYKKKSGRYIKGNKNGISKEYILGTNILVFEGKYLNGKRNGKGKEFYNDKIKFEGEYSDGRIIKGIGYNSRGKVILTIKKMENIKNIMTMVIQSLMVYIYMEESGMGEDMMIEEEKYIY